MEQPYSDITKMFDQLKIKKNSEIKQLNGVFIRVNSNSEILTGNDKKESRDIFIEQLLRNGRTNVVLEKTPTILSMVDEIPVEIVNDVEHIIPEEVNDIKNENIGEVQLKNVNDVPLKKVEIKRTKKIKIDVDGSKTLKKSNKDGLIKNVVDVKEKKKTETILIKTQNYYMNNRKMFLDNIGKLLDDYKKEIDKKSAVISCKNQGNGEFKQLTHQKVVLEYLNLNTPYRGLLLYHGLGSGKTCTAIAIAEGMKSRSKIIVMTPASLQMNFISELKKCGDPLYKKLQYWEFIPIGSIDELNDLSSTLNIPIDYITKKKGVWSSDATKDANYSKLNETQQKQIDAQLKVMIQSKYTNLNYNGGIKPNVLKELSNDYTTNPFDNSVVIIDEAHNFVSRIVNKLPKTSNVVGNKIDLNEKFNKTISGRLYNYLMEASNVRIVLLTGTPIINYPNEIGILFNILRGFTKTWSFDIDVGTSNKVDRDSILDMLEMDNFVAHDYISYSGNKLTITRNPYGFVNRKQVPKRRKNLGGTKRNNKQPTSMSVSRKNNSHKTEEKYVALPQLQYTSDYNGDSKYVHGGSVDDTFAGYNGVSFNPNSRMTDALFVSRIREILQKNNLNIVNSSLTNHKCLPDNSEIFNNTFIDSELGKINNEDLFKRRILGLTSYFRSAQENLLPQYEMSESGNIFHIIKCEMSDYQFGVYEKIRKAEDDNEKSKRKNKQQKGKNGEELFTIPSTYRIFSRACCNFAFPDEIPRPKPDNIQGDNDEDAELIQMKNDKEFDDDREDDDDDDQNEGHSEGQFRRKIAKTKQLAVSNTNYQTRISEAMEKLNSTNYLSTSELLKYSPKFSKILDNIIDVKNVGVHLLYSNFRTIEGVGILKLILEMSGFAEFKIRKTTNSSWDIIEKAEDADKQKYVLYTGTESTEEKEIIRNVFNGTWELVPGTIANKLHKKSPENKNLYGSIIKLLMITSSGAEGINLKNTRYVHIVEPYWHMVRIQQVIGRARRICSHEELPLALQTIKIFVYISSLSEKQKKDDKHIELRLRDTSKKDNSTPITTDESLFEIADAKDTINQQLLTAVKSSAIDCRLYNKGKENYLCYSVGKVSTNQFLSIPDIGLDKDNRNDIVDNYKHVTKFNLRQFTVPSKDGDIVYYVNTNNNDIFNGNDVDNSRAIDDYDNLTSIGRLNKDKENNFKITFYK